MQDRTKRERSDAYWGAIEAKTLAVVPTDPAEARRYANPPENTPYALSMLFTCLEMLQERRFLT
jgi:hypothetical protein